MFCLVLVRSCVFAHFGCFNVYLLSFWYFSSFQGGSSSVWGIFWLVFQGFCVVFLFSGWFLVHFGGFQCHFLFKVFSFSGTFIHFCFQLILAFKQFLLIFGSTQAISKSFVAVFVLSLAHFAWFWASLSHLWHFQAVFNSLLALSGQFYLTFSPLSQVLTRFWNFQAIFFSLLAFSGGF